MLDLRLYRLTLLPFAVGLIIVAFTLHTGPGAIAATQTAPGFDAQQAYSLMVELGSAGRGDPAPGSPADDAIARAIATGRSPSGLAHANFQSVRIVRTHAATVEGSRTIDTVIATRYGRGPGIALIADRGGPGPASSLGATATLLEIADVFRDFATARPLTLVFTSGGASGLASAIAELPAGIGGAIVIGAPPAAPGRGVGVTPYSTAGGLAPAQLRVAVETALGGSLGVHVADAGVAEQFTRIALPLSVGAQGPLLAAGIPALAVGASAAGEAGTPAPALTPTAGPAALGSYGQALVGLTATLGAGRALVAAPTRDLSIGSQILDAWGVRLLTGLLLLSLAACTLDVLARARRRKAPVGAGLRWGLSFAAPFLLAGVFAIMLGATALLPATPATPVTSAQLPLGGAGVAALVSVALVFALAWLLRMAVRRRAPAPAAAGAGPALLLIGCLLAFLIWLGNPFTALLVLAPLHVWLVALTREPSRSPGFGLFALVASLALPLAALAVLCASLGLSPLGLAWTLLLALAGGSVSLGGLLLDALACGCAVAAGTILLAPAQAITAPAAGARRPPLGYAGGPGSLGGTSSALHR